MSDAKRGVVAVLDVITGSVLHSVAVGPQARHITIDPSGRTLWVALGPKAEEVAVVDVRHRARPRLVRRFRPPFLAHDVGFAPGSRHAWVSSGAVNEVALYSTRTGRLLARIPADEPPQHFTFRGERVYHASGESGTLRVHAADGRLLRLTRIPDESYNVQQGRGWVVTPGLGTGTLRPQLRGRIVRTEKIARSSPTPASCSPRRSRAWDAVRCRWGSAFDRIASGRESGIRRGRASGSAARTPFDLVFVFAFTQVTTLLTNHSTWAGLGQALLIMTALWWAWQRTPG